MIKRFKAEGLSGNKQAMKIKDSSAAGADAEVTAVGAKAFAKMTSK